jgi:hypothetical protein
MWYGKNQYIDIEQKYRLYRIMKLENVVQSVECTVLEVNPNRALNCWFDIFIV